VNRHGVVAESTTCAENDGMDFQPLTKEEEDVIVHRGTEAPYTNEYDNFFESGVFVCRRCLSPLYGSEAKFHSGCGWPSFDDIVPNSVKRVLDADGRRTEIQCATCGGHLGHVFEGEGFTKKDTRHCVNSLSIKFIPEKK
jgi:peptide-methionine (R)-S-oxide reductase